MKIFNFILFTLVSLWLLIGCAKEEIKPESQKVNVIEKNVIVGCPTQHVTCDFSGDNFVPTKKLLECVKLQKYVIEQCQKVTPTQN